MSGVAWIWVMSAVLSIPLEESKKAEGKSLGAEFLFGFSL